MLALIPLVMNIAGLLGSGLLKITIKLYGKKASYAMASLMGLISCIWLVIDTNLSENATTLDPLLGPPSSDNAQFYLLASMMGGGAAMVVILSLTSAADLIDSNTVNCILPIAFNTSSSIMEHSYFLHIFHRKRQHLSTVA